MARSLTKRFFSTKHILGYLCASTIFFILYSITTVKNKKEDVIIEDTTDMTVTDVVTFGVSINNKDVGSIKIGLFGNVVPKTVKNFVALAQGFQTVHDDKMSWLSYTDTVFHRVIKDFIIQGGDLLSKNNSGNDISLFGGLFPDENFILSHSGEGWVAMANSGPNTNGCQFYITLAAAPWLDGHHVVLGKVLEGMNVVQTIAEVATVKDQPQIPVVIKRSRVDEPSVAQGKAFMPPANL